MKVYIDTSLRDYERFLDEVNVKDEYLEKVKLGIKLTLEEKIKIMRQFIGTHYKTA